MKIFDRKFGEQFMEGLPSTPAVYLFKTHSGTTLYVGKAKNIRRRLQQYRNASRRKKHQKMRQLVQEADSLEFRLTNTELEALILENALIRKLKPPFNVDGTYSFLYPAIGIGGDQRQTLLCFTTDTQAWSALNMRWYGVFRSRLRARSAFNSLIFLLSMIGHIERTTHLPPHTKLRGSRLAGFRRISPDVIECLEQYLSGDDQKILVPLVHQLLEKPRARRDACDVQEHFQVLISFHRTDLIPLRSALASVGRSDFFISQDDRDTLFFTAGVRLGER